MKSLFLSYLGDRFNLCEFAISLLNSFQTPFSSRQVQRTSFFEGTDVEFATLSEEVIRS